MHLSHRSRSSGFIVRSLVLLLLGGTISGCFALFSSPPPSPYRIREYKPNSIPHPHRIAFSPDMLTVYTAGGYFLGPGKVTAWDTNSGEKLAEDSSHQVSIRGFSVSPDGKWIATAASPGEVKVFEAKTLKLFASFRADCSYLASTAFSADSRLVAVGGDKVVQVWDIKTKTELANLAGINNNDINAISFSPDGKSLLVPDVEGHEYRLRFYDLDGFKERLSFDSGDLVQAISFSPDGKHMVLALSRYVDDGPDGQGHVDSCLQVLDAVSLKKVSRFTGHKDTIMAVNYTPDGRYLVSASLDKTVKVWDTRTGRTVHSFQAHNACVRSMDLSKDGKLLATCGDDGSAKLWNFKEMLDAAVRK